jgi:hypothetical protein
VKERGLRFPDDLDAGLMTIFRGGERLESCRARGLVLVPADAEVWLDVTSPVRGLGALGPDDVQAVLTESSATDDDLGRLGHLTGLRRLDCSKARRLTDAGIAALEPLRRLRHLDLYATGVTDAGLRHLAGMVELEWLHLGSTQVKGPGLTLLKGLQRLRTLSLECTDVDDSVVPDLLRLRSLRVLAIWETRLSTKGIAALNDAIPEQVVARGSAERLAREQARAAVLGILSRRLWPDLAPGTSGEEALRRLLPAGSVIAEFRLPGGHPTRLNLSLDKLDVVAVFLPRLYGTDIRVVTPDGLDRWIPWLRPRGLDRRRIRATMAPSHLAPAPTSSTVCH